MEQNKLSCIFGEDIKDDCPVRREFIRPDIIKSYITGDEVADELNQMMATIMKASKMEFSMLAQFCQCCPYLKVK